MHLPRPFAREMEADKPPVLWLLAYDCSHGAMQVHVEYPKSRSMLLGCGWKSFARAHNIEDGHVLRFKLAQDDMLSIKFYGRRGYAGGAPERIFGGDATLLGGRRFCWSVRRGFGTCWRILDGYASLRRGAFARVCVEGHAEGPRHTLNSNALSWSGAPA
ncbi:l-ascorbate oxidase-like protein [Hordeum vulgare]|nr:l-ascorbate oxidase-like protein [Hordeum vulgare]